MDIGRFGRFIAWAALLAAFAVPRAAGAGGDFMTDTIQAKEGAVKITFIAHATFYLEWNGKIIHVDPVGQYADYALLPKADLILVTHEHGDHLDPAAVKTLVKEGTRIVGNPAAASRLGTGAVAMKNGESTDVLGVHIEAVPAYNTSSGHTQFHPKGRDNGYVLTLGGLRLYVAGDTEDIPEMKAVGNVDVAFLPMNQPYTMTPEQAASAARSFMPRILYPYHFGDTDTSLLAALLKGTSGIEVRIRNMK
jgi:L-ascorbate metabolism protein UlaG (beta-lactamase superfamily)